MQFELSVTIERPPADVFAFLRDKDKYPQEEKSPVLVLQQTTPGPAVVGTRYREVVQMLPGYRGEILSEIMRFEPGVALGETFSGAGMAGELLYEFRPEGTGTRLVQTETLSYRGGCCNFWSRSSNRYSGGACRTGWRRLGACWRAAGWFPPEDG